MEHKTTKAFIVVGLESSGTRAVTKCFCLAGCFGDASHNQLIDDLIAKGRISEIPCNQDIVYRKSIPHEKQYFSFEKINSKFIHHDVCWVICIRDWFFLWKSKLNQKRKGSANDAQIAICDEYIHVFEQLLLIDSSYYLFSTSLLFLNPERALIGLSAWTGLKFPMDKIKENIYDADAKYK